MTASTSPGLAGSLLYVVAGDFTELLEGWIVLKHAGYLRRMEPFRYSTNLRGFVPASRLISLTPYVKPYFFLPVL